MTGVNVLLRGFEDVVVLQALHRPVGVLPQLTLDLMADAALANPNFELDRVMKMIDRLDHDRVDAVVQDLEHPRHGPASLETVAELRRLTARTRTQAITLSEAAVVISARAQGRSRRR